MENEKLQSKIKNSFLIKILAKARIFLLFVICYLLFVKPAFAKFKTFFGDVSGACEYWKKVFDFSVAAAGILTVLTLMFGGLYYLVSGGDKEKIGKAKEIMSAGIAGFLLVLLGWVIFNTVAPQLNQCKIEVEMIKLKGDVPLSEEEVEKVPENLCAGIPEEKLFLTQEECEETGGENKTKCEGYCVKGKLEIDEKKSEEEKWCCKKEPKVEPVVEGECGKNIVNLAEDWIDTEFGPCHCADFVSKILITSGCESNIYTPSATVLRNKLETLGWQRVSSPQPGDIGFKKCSGPAEHVGIYAGGGESIHASTEKFKKNHPERVSKYNGHSGKGMEWYDGVNCKNGQVVAKEPYNWECYYRKP